MPNPKDPAQPQSQPAPKQAETIDGLPPGAHAGGANEPVPTLGAPPPPEGHIDDPKISPKEQTEKALRAAGATQPGAPTGQPKQGHRRVRLKAPVTVGPRNHQPGEVVDLTEADYESVKHLVEDV